MMFNFFLLNLNVSHITYYINSIITNVYLLNNMEDRLY